MEFYFAAGYHMIKLFTRFIDHRSKQNSEITEKENHIMVIELLLSTTDSLTI